MAYAMKVGTQALIARGIVAAEAVARKPGVIRQAPRMGVTIDCTGRQATDKLVGISNAAAADLGTLFWSGSDHRGSEPLSLRVLASKLIRSGDST